MNFYRNISSVFILLAYTLFLFHDYIPHTHATTFPGKLQAEIHQHHTDHQHVHHAHQTSIPDHQDHQDHQDEVPNLHENAKDDHHRHHLVYRKSSKSKILFPQSTQAAVSPYLIASLPTPNIYYKIYSDRKITYTSPQLYASPQLRAPPISL